MRELESLLAAAAREDDIASLLSDDVMALLEAAVESNGRIQRIHTAGGLHLNAGGRNFLPAGYTPREEARWEAALKELLGQQLVEGVGSHGTSFRVTKQGYEVADKRKAARSSQGKS